MKLWNREKKEEKRSIRTVGKRVLDFIRRHKKITIVLVLFLCILAAVLVILGKRKQMPQSDQTRTIETAAVEKMDLVNSISVTGTIASAETRTVTTSLSNLEVTQVCVEVGDVVQEGDVICRFDSEDIEEALATARNNYSVNQQIDALGEDYQTQYEESIEQAEDTLQNARNKRDEAKSAYQSAADAESKAKTAYEKANAALDEKQSIYTDAKAEALQKTQAYEEAAGRNACLSVNADDSGRRFDE